MENLIARNEVYAGELYDIRKINSPIFCRCMLFKLNHNSLAQDLIYTTHNYYPLDNYSNNNDSKFIIQNYVKLEHLLKYLEFCELLNQVELNAIYKQFISHNWWIEHNSELFDDNSLLSKELYFILKSIGSHRNGTPNKNEPDFSFIKRK